MLLTKNTSLIRVFRVSYATNQKIKVYTKTGDEGMTSLFNMERRKKTDLIFDALGNTDETNSVIGQVNWNVNEKDLNLI